MTASLSSLDRFVDKAGQLYTLPAVALKVLELTEQPRLNPRALKQCLEQDPALTAKLLRVVNSSLFGLSRQVSDLNQAIALLGIRPLKLLVLGFSLPDTLTANVASGVLSRYWHHTLLRAVICRELAQRYWKQPGDEAFLAGLLQDLGTLVLIQALNEPYLRFLQSSFTVGSDRLSQETESLGFNHCELSARLLDRWGLPNHLVRTVEASGRSADSPLNWAAPLADVLRTADLFATYLIQGQAPALGLLLKQVAATNVLSRSELVELVTVLEPQVVQLAEAMAVQIPTGPAHHNLLLRAQRQLAAVAEDAALALLTPPETKNHEAVAAWEQSMSLTTAALNFSDHSEAKPLRRASTEPREFANGPHSGLDESGPDRLLERTKTLAANGHTAREPLSLILVEIDGYEEYVAEHGGADADRLSCNLFALGRQVDHPTKECHVQSAWSLALLLPNCDRAQAVRLGAQLQRAAQRDVAHPGAFNISVGVATADMPAKNFRSGDLLAAATRCLHGAQRSGGTLKSIGVY